MDNLIIASIQPARAGDYLVLMSCEGGNDGGSSVDAVMVRFRVNGATVGSEYHQEWEDNTDFITFAKAQLVTGLSAGNNTFAIEVQSRNAANGDFHRPRIIIIRKASFDQIVNTSDTTGAETTSTTPVDFTGLNTVYTPNQQEYVVVLANAILGFSTTDAAVAELRDDTAALSYRVGSGEYENDNAFDSGRDQQPTLLAHAKQIS